jgi:hypothetical protein
MGKSAYLRVLSWGGVAVFVGCVGIARIGAQDPGDPFHDHGDKGELIHVLPTPAAAHNPHESQPTFASRQSGAYSVFPASYGAGNLTDHFGPEISGASFRAIYWNALVAHSAATSQGYLTISAQIDAFINSYGSDSAYSSASPYDDFSIVQQYGSSNSISPSLVNDSYHVDGQRTTFRISDSQIQSYLASLFNNGIEKASASTIYGVYFPHGMRVSLQGGSSCTSFCGYHSHFTYNGQLIKYAVFPYADCSGCSLPGLSVADMLTIVTSHEIRESVTDSLGTAWFDSKGYEADDKCAWHNLYQTSNGSFWVQPEYSNGGTVNGTSYPGPGCVVPR